ncbi:hypothetical protein AB0H43_03095 [Hamadaea sp. NPDC050747]|uniref:hypothetical protein n=1 Tax=Hamadaea sp. NPDC050747 TaxID=3155789 RepID=UPI0033E70787
MTTPKISTISRGGSRFYVHPGDGAVKSPGVTSIIDMLPKGFLGPWNAKVVAEHAVNNLGEIVGLTLRNGPAGAVDFLKGAPRRDTAQAADIGSQAHDLFERMALGETITRVHPDLKGFVDAFGQFLKEFSPEFIHMEETVWSETHDYAGSFDAFAIIDGQRVWIDYKTTRSGIHEEVGLQLAAYRHAEYIIRPDGSRVPMPGAEGGAVLWIPNGHPEDWQLVPIRCDEETFSYFLHLREIFRYEKEFKPSIIGKPLNKQASAPKVRPTIRRAA